jgi:LuxR family maltose regulon positive regulatory protein
VTDQFSSVTASRLTLVTGSAGSGKSAAVREWAEQVDGRIAWVTLDAADNESFSFWHTVMSAVQRAAPEISDHTRPHFDDRHAPDNGFVQLLDGLASLNGPLVLILDDFQTVESATVLDEVHAVLQRKPQLLRVVIVSRSDPHLPLALWRVRGELTEVREAELRFRPDEARAYLTSFPDLELDDHALAVLSEKTEGWIAGLQLAVISLQGNEDSDMVIERFRGTDRFIADFLVDEVLAQQPDDIRDFLLATSVLDRFDAALCETVTGRRGAELQLRRLEAANLFLVRLDATGTWFRYHALFVDLLRSELEHREPERARELHERAAVYLSETGRIAAAVEQFLAAGNETAAFSMISQPTALLQDGPVATNGWIDVFPPAFIAAEPARMLVFADALRTVGRLDESAVWLQRAAVAAPPDGPEQAWLGALWSRWYQAAGDADAAIELGVRSLDLVAAHQWEDEPDLAGLGLDLARAFLLLGHTERARRSLLAQLDAGRLDSIATELEVPALLARVAACEGRLRDAEAAAERALRAAVALRVPQHPATADALLARARVLRERDNAADATRDLSAALAIAERTDSLPYMLLAQIDLARVMAADVGPYDALGHFRAVRASPHTHLPASLAQAADRFDAELSLRVGDVERAAAIVSRLPAGVEREMLAATVEVASGRLDDARERLRALVPIRIVDRIRAELLRAVAASNFTESRRHVAAATALAAPEGFRQVFIANGPAVSQALRSLATSPDLDPLTADLVADVAGLPRLKTNRSMADPFSEREQSVLRYLPTTLSHHDIATELFISVNTLKTHVKSIYRKLGVGSRADAVLEARRLGLIRR